MPLWIVSILLHAYVGARVVPALPGGLGPALTFAAVLVLSAAAMPMSLLARRLRTQPWSDRLAWAGALAMGLFSSLFLISDEPQQAHLVSYQGMKMDSPPQEVNHEDEPSAISTWTFDGRVHGPLRQR